MNNNDIKINSIWKRFYPTQRDPYFIIVIDIVDNIVRFKILDEDTDDIYDNFTNEFIRRYTHVQ